MVFMLITRVKYAKGAAESGMARAKLMRTCKRGSRSCGGAKSQTHKPSGIFTVSRTRTQVHWTPIRHSGSATRCSMTISAGRILEWKKTHTHIQLQALLLLEFLKMDVTLECVTRDMVQLRDGSCSCCASGFSSTVRDLISITATMRRPDQHILYRVDSTHGSKLCLSRG